MEKWIEAFKIFAPHCKNEYCIFAEHDQIYSVVGKEEIPVDSPDGIRLTELGWFIDNDSWAKFT